MVSLKRLARDRGLKGYSKLRRWLKFAETLQITFEKQIDKAKTTYKTAYFNCKTKTITNPDDLHEAVNASQDEILQRIGA